MDDAQLDDLDGASFATCRYSCFDCFLGCYAKPDVARNQVYQSRAPSIVWCFHFGESSPPLHTWYDGVNAMRL